MGCFTAAFPPRVNANLYSFLLLMLFLETRPWGRGRGKGLFSLQLKKKKKTSADYCRYDFVLEKYTVISESVRTCSRVRALRDKKSQRYELLILIL